MIDQTLILQQVALIREAAANFLVDTAYIKRKTGITVTRGQTTILYADPVEVACRVINRSGNEETPIASQYRAVQQTYNTALFKMQLPFGTEVGTDDIIVYNNEQYEIVNVPAQHVMMGAFIISLQVRT